MNVPIKPLVDKVVAISEVAPSKTASGLYLPDAAKEKPVISKVVAIGPDVKNIKIGEKIIYKEYSTTELKVNEVDYLIIKEEDILATIAK